MLNTILEIQDMKISKMLTKLTEELKQCGSS